VTDRPGCTRQMSVKASYTYRSLFLPAVVVFIGYLFRRPDQKFSGCSVSFPVK
jgi:hypothetical protein